MRSIVMDGSCRARRILLGAAMAAAVSLGLAMTPTAVGASSKPREPAVVVWFSARHSAIETAADEMSSVSTDASSNNSSAVESDCTQLKQDATTDQGAPAAPDAKADADWKAFLRDLRWAASACLTGYSTNSSKDLATATTDARRTGAEAQDLNSRVQKVKSSYERALSKWNSAHPTKSGSHKSP